MKNFLLTVVVTGIAVVSVSKALSKNETERPPQIAVDRWLPISDTAGVAITSMDPYPATEAGVEDKNERRIEKRLPKSAAGTLMIKKDGHWVTVRWELELPPGQILPLRDKH